MIGKVDVSSFFHGPTAFEIGDATNEKWPLSGRITPHLGSEAVIAWRRIHDAQKLKTDIEEAHASHDVRDDPAIQPFRVEVGIFHARPLQYLERWMADNEVCEDDVHLTSVIEWSDGHISFAISQPQYHGAPATDREIEHFFTEAGWTRIRDATGHLSSSTTPSTF